jgi:hypothetical protein
MRILGWLILLEDEGHVEIARTRGIWLPKQKKISYSQ